MINCFLYSKNEKGFVEYYISPCFYVVTHLLSTTGAIVAAFDAPGIAVSDIPADVDSDIVSAFSAPAAVAAAAVAPAAVAPAIVATAAAIAIALTGCKLY